MMSNQIDDPKSAVGPVGRADAMGWASVALGVPMLTMPRRLLETAGIRADTTATAVVAGVGVRELMATLTLNAMRHRRVGMWSRVAGDTMDLTLLGVAFLRRRRDPARLLGTIGFIGSIFAVDLLTALQLDRAERAHMEEGEGSSGVGAPAPDEGGPAHVRTAVTIARQIGEVRAAFSEFEWTALDAQRLQSAGAVRFETAPGDRGTELHLDFDPDVPGGSAGAAALKLLGRAPDQRVSDELRRFKALVETGVIVKSDKSPEGPSTPRQMMQRPGQPQEANR